MTEDYCKCDDTIPITWLGTCEKCGKKYLFPRSRTYVLHPKSEEECLQIMRDAWKPTKWTGFRVSYDDGTFWNKVWHTLLDAEFISILDGYFLLGSGIFCNPRLYGMMELYFTTPTGAEEYRELEFKTALYPLYIFKKLK